VIQPKRKEELQKYITGIVSGYNQKLIAINCMPDHTHILVGLKPDAAPSDLIGRIKTGSTNHINEQRWIGCRFSWQEGFGAFSVSHSHLGTVINYVHNQENHHRRKSFHEGYVNFSSVMTLSTTSDMFSNP
jgi:REP-associated tyrosine transposase